MLCKALALGAGYLGLRAVVASSKLPSDSLLMFDESCIKQGYTVDTHWVTTKDGYILRLFRIGKGHPNSGPPVVLVHGLTQTAHQYILCRSATPPAFELVNQNFDVWLLNTRGNYYSRLHKTLPSSDAKYWEWSAYEISIHDLPATFDYILQKTSNTKLNYIGNSQGGHVLLNLLSYKPEYNAKVNLAALLSPVGGTITGNARYFKLLTSKTYTDYLGLRGKNFIADYEYGGSFHAKLAMKYPGITENLYRDRFDHRLNGDNYADMPYYIQKFSGGTSVHNLRYFKQLQQRKSPMPVAYDFGSKELNTQKYGQAEPPRADYSKISAKLALFYGTHDQIVTVKDGEKLLTQLPKVSVVFKKMDCNLDHAGFMISSNQQHIAKIVELIKTHK